MQVMPGMMIVTKPSRLGFDETVAAIQKPLRRHAGRTAGQGRPWHVATVSRRPRPARSTEI